MIKIKSEITENTEVLIRAFSGTFRGRQLVFVKKIGVMPPPGKQEKRNFRS